MQGHKHKTYQIDWYNTHNNKMSFKIITLRKKHVFLQILCVQIYNMHKMYVLFIKRYIYLNLINMIYICTFSSIFTKNFTNITFQWCQCGLLSFVNYPFLTPSEFSFFMEYILLSFTILETSFQIIYNAFLVSQVVTT